MKNRHDSFMSLIITHGQSFGLPVSNTESDSITPNINSKDSSQILEYLNTNGINTLNNQEYDVLANMLSKLQFTEINNSVEISLIAAITYSEIGNVIEADYFISKCESKIDEYSNHDKENLEIFRLRIDFILGRISMQAFYNEISKLFDSDISELNKVNLKINKYYIEIIERIKNRTFEGNFERSLLNTIDDILDLKISESKIYQLLLTIADPILSYVFSRLNRSVTKSKNQLKNGDDSYIISFPTDQISQVPFNIVDISLEYAEKAKNELVKAEAIFRKAKYFYLKEFRLFLINEGIPSLGMNSKYLEAYEQLISALKYFKSKLLFRNSHRVLTAMHDLLVSFELMFGKNLNKISTLDITEEIIAIERKNGIQPFESMIKGQFDIIKNSPKSFIERLIQSNDGLLKNFAETKREFHNLPQEQFQNIFDHYKKLQFIYKNRSSKNIEAFTTESIELNEPCNYSKPVFFILRNIKTGYETFESIDVIELLKDMEGNGM